MINSLISALFSLILKVLSFIGNLLLLPLTLLINGTDGNNGLFPNMATYLETFEDFFNDYIFSGIAFFREVFFNFTHFPRALFGLGIGFILAVFGLRLGLYVFRFAMAIWKFFRKGDTT